METIFKEKWALAPIHSISENTSVSLDEHFASFIDRQVQACRYGSGGEVVRAGLRLLEEHEAKLKVF